MPLTRGKKVQNNFKKKLREGLGQTKFWKPNEWSKEPFCLYHEYREEKLDVQVICVSRLY